jgi:nucleoside-diphosphate-sugar epimerase
MPQTVLILGASGLFGSHAATAFTNAGWTVRRYQRGTDMAKAAMGADLIVNALNPPNYHNWAQLIPQITADVIAAAKASGATILVAGNVYVYGTEPGPWGPNTPHNPNTRKGRIRADMEATYAAAATQGTRTIVLRAGEFVTPSPSARTVWNMIVLKSLPKGRLTSFGNPTAKSAYAYLPDMARAAVALAEIRETLPAFADIPLTGLTLSMTDLAAEITAQTGTPIRIKRFNWLQLRLLSPFWELARELLEMRYLYDMPYSLSPEPLQRLLPNFKFTPLSQVVAEHLMAK